MPMSGVAEDGEGWNALLSPNQLEPTCAPITCADPSFKNSGDFVSLDA